MVAALRLRQERILTKKGYSGIQYALTDLTDLKSMKRILFLCLVMTGFAIHSYSQDKWTVFINGKKICTGAPDDGDEAKRVFQISRAMLKKGSLKVVYRAAEMQKDWARTVSANSLSTGNEIVQVKSANNAGSFTIALARIRNALLADKAVEIYTICLPKDPKVAMAVRVRRYLVCRIELK